MKRAYTIKNNITVDRLSIYDVIEIGDEHYWLPSKELEFLLSEQLVGLNLNGLPLRTRSKVVKSHVCLALGYPVPNSFKKTQPRFACQNFDVYTQKSNNLQIWNEEVSPSRRYVLIRITDDDVISQVKVVSGDTISDLDKTGKLTTKYQASLNRPKTLIAEQLSSKDTDFVQSIYSENYEISKMVSPSAYPEFQQLMPLDKIFKKLCAIVGQRIPYEGALQERNRGGNLHKLVCKSLGYSYFNDDGKFPDVKHQLLEVKLQTSPTIDLGLFLPNDASYLDLPKIAGENIRMCDVRYAIFYGELFGNEIEITNFYLVVGKDFFSHFRQFEGKKINRKLQIPLGREFWEED
ncbi:restriction endonuclease [Paenibacillus sp. KS-LC4]|uniref:restriction endonuclease n=1 Tax=Paenibacillus sp. KS-LC4 TaxID=2979727 RepID=UPI0030D392D8